jgi:hypothetical protein
MENIINSALLANSESSIIEFKIGFDIGDLHDWCEIIKDIIAIANTDGGVIIIGLDGSGIPVGMSDVPLLALDPADITNKIYKYTGYQFSEFELTICEKTGQNLIAIVIQNVPIPIVFEKTGSYEIEGGKTKTAFNNGTVYFRHGAKSEPGNLYDLQRAFEKRLESTREIWFSNIKQVIEAPLGATFVTIPPTTKVSLLQGDTSQVVKIVDSPNALLVNVKEEDMLKITPLDYKSLNTALHERYSNFVLNSTYHKLRKSLENNSRFCHIRYLDPKNSRSGRKCFYSPNIFEEFDKHYVRR